jgi:hypothetical protein
MMASKWPMPLLVVAIVISKIFHYLSYLSMQHHHPVDPTEREILPLQVLESYNIGVGLKAKD